MKFLYALLLLVLAAYLGAFALDKDYEVSRSQVIAATPEAVHAVVEDLHTWESWSDFKPPSKEGTTPLSEFKGAERGVGAIWRWGSIEGLDEIRPAEIEIIGSSVAEGLRYRMTLDGGRVDTLGTISFEPEAGGVRVTMVTSGELQGHWWRYFSVLADKKIGPILWKSLEGLKARLESPEASPEPVETENLEPGSAASEPDPQAND